MRQEIAPPPDLTDPLAILQDIVGKSLQGNNINGTEAGTLDKPVELVEDIDFAGMSLHDLADQEDAASEHQVRSDQTIEECEYVHLSLYVRNLPLIRRR